MDNFNHDKGPEDNAGIHFNRVVFRRNSATINGGAIVAGTIAQKATTTER